MTAGWRSAGEESSVDEEVDAAIRIARQLAVVPQDPANREEACEIFRRFGIKIGLTVGERKLGPKRMVRKLKGGVVVYGDADFPAAARPTPATDTAGSTFTGPQAANPFARALCWRPWTPTPVRRLARASRAAKPWAPQARPQAANPAGRRPGA